MSHLMEQLVGHDPSHEKRSILDPRFFPLNVEAKVLESCSAFSVTEIKFRWNILIWPVDNFSLISWCLFLQGKVNKRKTQWWMFPSPSQDTRHPQGPARLYETARVLPVISSCYIVVALLYCTFVHIFRNSTYCAKYSIWMFSAYFCMK